ncbi:MAG TPA: SufE family protein [Gemmatimonadales bacterium]|nr:SufE family protein [Gemmatimonadales bacterium]
MANLDRTIQRFASADSQLRLELLLDYAKKLPALPERYQLAKDKGENQVPECMSPVFLFLEANDGKLTLFADAPVEAPTVRGFVSLLAREIKDASPTDVAAIPSDLLDRLKLTELLGMTRMQGLTAIVSRIKRMAAAGIAD